MQSTLILCTDFLFHFLPYKFLIHCLPIFRGNSLLVGAVGSHLTTLCQLALHVADVQVLRIDTSKQSNFFDGLRSAVRLTGSEGKILTLMFTVSVRRDKS